MSITSFVAAVAALEVDGVRRTFAYPPMQLNAADLPAMYPRPPASDYAPLSVCDDTADEMSCELVLAVQAAGLGTQAVNYAALLEMADALNAALKASQFDIGALVTWRLQTQDQNPIIIGQTPYWGVTAIITKRG